MWNKQHVERVPEGYAKKFPQDLGECLICKKPHSGIYMGVVNMSPTDNRVPGYLQGVVATALFAFSLCETCYDLPDIETRVAVTSGGGSVSRRDRLNSAERKLARVRNGRLLTRIDPLSTAFHEATDAATSN